MRRKGTGSACTHTVRVVASGVCGEGENRFGQARGGGARRHLRRPLPGAVRVHAARVLGGEGHLPRNVSLDTETSVGARVGIVEAKGTIGETAPAGVDADKVVKLLKKYEKDDDIKAIVMRVDSPGRLGGAVAGDPRRDQAHQGEEEGRRLDGRPGRVGRLLHLRPGRPDSTPSPARSPAPSA